MANEILCPSCGHSLAFHPYDDSDDGCQAPLGGLTSHNKCGCPMTLHIFVLSLQKQITTVEVEKLKFDNKLLTKGAESLVSLIKDVKTRNERLEGRLKRIGIILNEAKMLECHPLSDLFAKEYKRQIHELLDKALLEMETPNG